MTYTQRIQRLEEMLRECGRAMLCEGEPEEEMPTNVNEIPEFVRERMKSVERVLETLRRDVYGKNYQ
jgi:hypothetical protein